MNRLNWDKLLSKKRLHAIVHTETDFDARTEYQRDADRIVFSSAFRRLQDKTQVMPLPDSDFVRSRLTHSIEVASIGRSIGKIIGKFIIEEEKLENCSADDFGNIIAAACLAHDIGNPPFGHSGEKAIGKFFKKFFKDHKDEDGIKFLSEADKQDFLNFEGNASGFRILTNDHPSGINGGLKLTYATLGTFSKYPKSSLQVEFNELGEKVKERQSQSKFGYFQEEKNLFENVAIELGLIQLSKSGEKSWCRHPLSFLLEAADSITYSIIDFEDAHKLGYIDTDTATELLHKIITDTKDSRCNTDDWRDIKDTSERVGALRAKAINALIYECAQIFKANYEGIMIGEFDKELSQEIPSIQTLKKIKVLSYSQYFGHSAVIDIELAGFEVLAGLLEAFVLAIEDPKDDKSKRLLLKMPKQSQDIINSINESYYKKLLTCSDFVSRMTDGHAMKLYKKLKGIEL